MDGGIGIKLVGVDPELNVVAGSLTAAGLRHSRIESLDEAIETQDSDPAEIFAVGPSLFFQTHISQIQKLIPAPEIILIADGKVPNLAKILMPQVAFADSSAEELRWEFSAASDTYRKKRRLEALRSHREGSWNHETNPAIQLVTKLMRKCTIAETFPDLLVSALVLKPVVDFQDCALLTLDADGNPIEAWHCSNESRDKPAPLLIPADLPSFGRGESNVMNFSSSVGNDFPWGRLTTHPWSSGMAISFSTARAPRKAGVPHSAVLAVFRRELIPFAEKDGWLFELLAGPLALALEKVVMLKAIGQASREWRSTFDGISEPLTVIDSAYQIVKANKAFAALVGQDIKKLKGRRCYTLLANRRSPCVGCPVGTNAQPQGGSRLQLADRNKKELLAWSYGIRTAMETYHFQFYRNVSKETALASALIQSEKMAALGRLVGAVAHEINNPLAGILATSQILLQEITPDAPESLADDLEEIRAAAWRSKKIIDDLLGFTSSEERQLEQADPKEVLLSTLTFCKAALREVDVRHDFEADVPGIFVSVNALQQVIFNLVTNAVHAMNGKGQLVLSVKRAGDSVEIDVRDSGPGIPPEKLKRVFDPFYTSKQEGSGTGLGLSIVKNLIQKMNARIEVSSQPGEGTEFRLFLPAGRETRHASHTDS